jgi:hypothetical protein
MKPMTDMEILETKLKAELTFRNLRERNEELEAFVDVMKPLLCTLAEALYGPDTTDFKIQELVEDAVNFINGTNTKATLQ